jgi:hypothetical protein
MKKTALFRIVSLALALTVLAPATLSQVAAQGGGCMGNAEIQEAISAGRIAPVGQVLAREGIPSSTQVLSVRVCEQGGGLQYVLAVLEASGEARNLTLPAQ